MVYDANLITISAHFSTIFPRFWSNNTVLHLKFRCSTDLTLQRIIVSSWNIHLRVMCVKYYSSIPQSFDVFSIDNEYIEIRNREEFEISRLNRRQKKPGTTAITIQLKWRSVFIEFRDRRSLAWNHRRTYRDRKASRNFR